MRNLSRLTNYANRLAAIDDYCSVARQLLANNPPQPTIQIRESSWRAIDKQTRILIAWAKANDIDITLPEGWNHA